MRWRDTGRDDPDEQFPVSRRPGFHAGVEGRLPFGAGDVVGRSLDEHAPALSGAHVDVVDLERHLVVGVVILVADPHPADCAARCGTRSLLVEGVVHLQHGRAEPAGVGDAADPACRYQPQALAPLQFLDHAVSHGGASFQARPQGPVTNPGPAGRRCAHDLQPVREDLWPYLARGPAGWLGATYGLALVGDEGIDVEGDARKGLIAALNEVSGLEPYVPGAAGHRGTGWRGAPARPSQQKTAKVTTTPPAGAVAAPAGAAYCSATSLLTRSCRSAVQATAVPTC